jgi:hypothetical protein
MYDELDIQEAIELASNCDAVVVCGFKTKTMRAKDVSGVFLVQAISWLIGPGSA